MPLRFDKQERDERVARTAAPVDFNDPGYNQDHYHICQNCGQDYTDRTGHDPCPNCGMSYAEHERAPFQEGRGEWAPEQISPTQPEQGPRWSKVVRSDASYPPEQPLEFKETAQPYRPDIYNDMVAGMAPAAQEVYQRQTQQGIPQAQAAQAAQQMHQQMQERAVEGQDPTVRIPVIGTMLPGQAASPQPPCQMCGGQGCPACQPQQQAQQSGGPAGGFVPPATIARVL